MQTLHMLQKNFTWFLIYFFTKSLKTQKGLATEA